MSEPKNAISLLTLESLALCERRKEELELAGDNVATKNELMVYLFLIERIRAFSALEEHMAHALVRLDLLERARANDHEIVTAVMRDSATTRRLTLDFGERVDILASNFGAVFDKLAEVAAQAEKQGAAMKADAKEALDP